MRSARSVWAEPLPLSEWLGDLGSQNGVGSLLGQRGRTAPGQVQVGHLGLEAHSRPELHSPGYYFQGGCFYPRPASCSVHRQQFHKIKMASGT